MATTVIGEVSAPSGHLVVFDIGLVGFLPREALAPLLVEIDAPKRKTMRVVGEKVGTGRYAQCWDYVAVELGDGAIAQREKIGEAAVDFARLAFVDRAALDAWKHDDSLDGKADFVFWGRDAKALAKAMKAPALAEGHGWTDLSVADAEAKSDRAARLKAENRWLLAMDLRPHSHHFHALAAARASKHGAGTIAIGRAKICLVLTTWGDGVFPVFVDADARGKAVRLRVQLSPTDLARRA